ncbi:hypothetical protein CTL2C_693 [Chlamydia trachomatis L2c]|nr:hypothetical protein CTL2C_693 [Chlamydia trachomatis L2c]
MYLKDSSLPWEEYSRIRKEKESILLLSPIGIFYRKEL